MWLELLRRRFHEVFAYWAFFWELFVGGLEARGDGSHEHVQGVVLRLSISFI